jgi:hypothetical protein|nr:MAG TPA: hypothetical protein [Caudoviricetes sp.]
MARAIDADRLKQAIDHDYYEHYTKYHDSDQTALIDMVMDDIDEMPTLTPPNEALTLEELREMDGVNALWVHNLAWGLHKPRFMLVHSVSEDWWTCCDFDGFETFCADDYGERYLLYRRPPEVSP